MAYSIEQWERAKAYYEAGTHTLQKIEDEVGINKGHLSRTAKKQQWQQGSKADYIEARVVIATTKATEKATTLQVLDDIADEAIRHRRLVFGVTESALQQLQKIADDGVKEVLVKTKVGGDILVEKETINLEPSDYESIINAADKASITLGVNQRHAKSGDVNVNATAGAVASNVQVTHQVVKETLQAFDDEY